MTMPENIPEIPVELTPEQRAHRFGWRLRVYIMLFLLWSMTLALPREIVVCVLALLPWAMIALMLWKSDLCRAPGGGLRAEFAMLIALVAGVLWYRSMADLRTVNPMDALRPAALPGLLLFTGILFSQRATASGWTGAILAGLIAAPLYGFGFIGFANAVFDHSPGQFFDTRVIEKKPGLIKMTAEIKTVAWGPVKEDRWEGFLPLGLWDNAIPAMRLCMNMRDGAFSIPWYQITSCRKERKECAKDDDCARWLADMQKKLVAEPVGPPQK